jgi:hypothetical protein
MALLPFLNTFGRVDNGRKYKEENVLLNFDLESKSREENETADFRDADSGWKKILYSGWELYPWLQIVVVFCFSLPFFKGREGRKCYY